MGVDKAALAFPKAQILHPYVRKRLVCRYEVIMLGSSHPPFLFEYCQPGCNTVCPAPLHEAKRTSPAVPGSSTLSKR